MIINLGFTFGVPGISVGGHLGGLVGGAIAGLVITSAERRAPRPVLLEVLGLVALGVASVAGALAAASAS